MHYCRGDLGAIEDYLLSELGAVRQDAEMGMRELRNSTVAILQRARHEHASAKGWWQRQKKELQGHLHAARQCIEESLLEKTAAGELTNNLKMRHAELVRQYCSHSMVALDIYQLCHSTLFRWRKMTPRGWPCPGPWTRRHA